MKNYIPTRQEQIEAMTPGLLRRAQATAAEVVGQSIRIQMRKATRTQSGVVVAGLITRCEVAGIRERQGSLIAQFNVWVGNSNTPVILESFRTLGR